jgi:hypothetical protein
MSKTMLALVSEQRRKIVTAVNHAHDLNGSFIKALKDDVRAYQDLAQPRAEIVSGATNTRIVCQCECPRRDFLDLGISNFWGGMEVEIAPDAGHIPLGGWRPDKIAARPFHAAGASP